MEKKLSRKEKSSKKPLMNGDLIMEKKILAIILKKYFRITNRFPNLNKANNRTIIKLTFSQIYLIEIIRVLDKLLHNQHFHK